MTRAQEDRVMGAHPLHPTARMVLLAIARAVPDGQTQVLANRAALARDLETTPDVVRRAILAGEVAGVVESGRNGVVAFRGDELPLGEERAPAKPSVVAAPPAAASPGPEVTGRWVMGEFARAWEAKYRQRYVFTPGKDHKLGGVVADGLKKQADAASTIVRSIRVYLEHDDPFYAKCAHAFGVYAANVNRFTVVVERDDVDARMQRRGDEMLREERQRARQTLRVVR